MRIIRRSFLAGYAAALAALVPISRQPHRAFAQASQVDSHSHFLTTKSIPLPNNYVDATTAAAIDEDLMRTPGFSIDQLMELAGLSVASAVHDYYQTRVSDASLQGQRRVLLFCGPGNNGGDGLVAARHLHQFGYKPVVIYPRKGRSNPALYANLVQQCEDLGIPVISDSFEVEKLTRQVAEGIAPFDTVVDALFGFSFSGKARQPFASMIDAMALTTIPTVSVDVPSGWHVDQGDVHSTGFTPSALVSLTAPKQCVRGYEGDHYIGGRFVNPQIAAKFNVDFPAYGINANQVAKYESPQCRDSTGVSMVYVTASDQAEGKKIAEALLADKLAACINIVPQILSLYEWEGKVEQSQEVLLLIKTRDHLVPALSAKVKSVHSYDVPEVISAPVTAGSADYLDWVKLMTKDASEAAHHA
eukprot:GSChrysophyteH1.ASY1.ANO1.3293.1 assembled CDS